MRLDCLYLNKREYSLEGSWIRKAEYQTDIKWILSRFSRHRSRISQHLTLFFPRRATIISAEYILIRSKWWWRPRAIFLFDFLTRNFRWWINTLVQNNCHIGILMTLQHRQNSSCTLHNMAVFRISIESPCCSVFSSWKWLRVEKNLKNLKFSKVWMFTNVQNSKIFDVLD